MNLPKNNQKYDSNGVNFTQPRQAAGSWPGACSAAALVNWLTTLVDKLSHILGGITSLGLGDKKVHLEILRQVLVANSICFATWVCWETTTKGQESSPMSSKIVSSRYMRRNQRFDEDCDVMEEDFPLPPDGNWQPMKQDHRVSRSKISVRTQSFPDGWRLLVGASASIISDSGDPGLFGVDMALDEIAEEAVQRPTRQTLEVISTVEKAFGGAVLVVSSSNHLLGATSHAIETVGRFTGNSLKRGEVLTDPLFTLIQTGVQAPGHQETEINGQHMTAWVVPLVNKGYRLLFIHPTLPEQHDHPVTESLSRREQEVLACLAKGKSNDEIATALNISPNTVKNHLDRVFKKLGVNNRFAAALASVRMS